MQIKHFTAYCFIAGGFLALGQTSVLTWHNDNARTGQNLEETTLTPANVNSNLFGRLFFIGTDGKPDSQPLYVPSVTIPGQGIHNVLYLTTEHDSVYAFDADNGALLWHVSLLPAGSNEVPSDDRNCSFQVTPEIGVTGTPVIDPSTGPHGTLYAVAMSRDPFNHYHQRLHALDLTSGAEQFGGPVEVQATSPGNGVETTFNPAVHKQRAALLLSNGVVYTTWSSHCDLGAYSGWVIGYNAQTLQQVSVLSVDPNSSGGGIWMGSGGPAADANGNIFLSTGNGGFDTTLTTGGFPINGNYGNAVIRIAPGGSTPQVTDYFTMLDTVQESADDTDFGSAGVMLLPPLNDPQGHSRSLMIAAGKDTHIYVLDRDNLGKFNSGTNAVYQDLDGSLPGGTWTNPAWFNNKLYYADHRQFLKIFDFSNGLLSATPSSQSSIIYPYPGGIPSISADGSTNGIVWIVEELILGGTNASILHAYDANDVSHELYNSNQAPNNRDHFGAANKFITPTIVNGKVYAASTTGVGVFGLLCSYAIAPQNVSLPAVPSGDQTVNVIASAGCAWDASSNDDFLSVVGGGQGTGSATVTYHVDPNIGPARSGTLTIAGHTLTVDQPANSAPVMSASVSSLNFGYSGLLATGMQPVTLTFTGGNLAWNAFSSQPNIVVSPTSGSGNGTFQVSASGGSDGIVTISAPGASNPLIQIPVHLYGVTPGVPFGSFDTPVDSSSGLAGAVAVTGWALDSIEVTGVGIWREPVLGESTSPNGLVFIGDAVLVPGARPDVEATYPDKPWNFRAGWGYLMLTNFLATSTGPAGTGTVRLHAIAVNKSGNKTDLGIHVVTLDNANATKPFGTIDTPGQGSTISGSDYVNFGWALTQNPRAIPTDGSTITVTVDGVAQGHPTYNQYRADVANAFPGLANSNGAVGFLHLNTTLLTNGMHSIGWLVTDNGGHSDGIGSRFFNVLNTGVTSAAPAGPVEAIRGRTDTSRNGSIEIDELGRIEEPTGALRGFLVVNGERRSLPAGSTLRNGVFYWQPGPGFLGEYALRFERPDGTTLDLKVRIRPHSYASPAPSTQPRR